jgi:hypothetical protein
VIFFFFSFAGLVVAADMTSVLQSSGYWASYNVPYFPEIFSLAAWQPLLGTIEI